MKRTYASIFAVLLALAVIPAMLVHAERGSGDLKDTLEAGAELNTTTNSTVREDNRGRINEDARQEIAREYRDSVQRMNEERQRFNADFRRRMNGTNQTFPWMNSSNQSWNWSWDDRHVARQDLNEYLKVQRERMKEDHKQALEQIKAMLERNKENFKQLQEHYKDDKQAFERAKQELKSCHGNDCRDARVRLNGEAQVFMGNAAEQMLTILSNLKTRVIANQNIDVDTSAKVVAQIDAHAAAIQAAKAKVAALSNSSDINATKQAADELKAEWTDARVTVRLAEGLLMHARFQESLNQLQNMQDRFKEARDKLASNGTNVTQLDADIASFGAKISAANTSYAQIKASYVTAMQSAKTEAEANTLLKSTQDQMKDTRDSLQDAKQDLRNIVRDFSGLSKQVLQDIAAKVRADNEASASVEAEVSA